MEIFIHFWIRSIPPVAAYCASYVVMCCLLQGASDHLDPVYDTVDDSTVGQPLASVENKPAKARRWVCKMSLTKKKKKKSNSDGVSVLELQQIS